MTWHDDKSLNRSLADGARTGTLQIAVTLIGAIFIVSLVLYGLNNESEEGATQKTAAPIQMTPQPAAGASNSVQSKPQTGPQQAQSQQGGGQQPSNPSSAASAPSSPNNLSSTAGQGPNTNTQGSQNRDPGKGMNQSPANASQNGRPAGGQ